MRLSAIGLCVLAASLPAARAQAQPSDDAVVVTATRFPERRLDAPVGMMVITARDIARDTARTLPEVLAHLGGLYVRDNSGSPDRQLDLRGFGITGDQNTLVLLDGVRLNENDLSSTKLSAIPLQSIARIEILRGSGSVLYGGGAAGGTINIITKGPRADTKEASLFAGAGSNGTLDARARVNLAGERPGALASRSPNGSDNNPATTPARPGDTTRRFSAYDAATGKRLWQSVLGGPISVSTITYAVNGKQYVEAAAGNSIFTFSLP